MIIIIVDFRFFFEFVNKVYYYFFFDFKIQQIEGKNLKNSERNGRTPRSS